MRLAALLVLVTVAACSSPKAPAPAAGNRWKVYDGPTLILEVSDTPGPITSTAMPPPGGKPMIHPYLSASALSAAHEGQLGDFLEDSTSCADFLARLRTAGFRVEPVP
jgi:hypothetical protein